jgi:hypothetical protein
LSGLLPENWTIQNKRVRDLVMVAQKETTPVGKPAISPAASGPVPAFPKKELDKWLKAHKT